VDHHRSAHALPIGRRTSFLLEGVSYQVGSSTGVGEAAMTEQELIEALADKEHASWARWMYYLFSQCWKDGNGCMVVPERLVDRWQKQINTPYAELSEQEKQSDRDEVAHILPIIKEYHTHE
jgi:hypothetical protein